ncbi:MAG: hypothetical protein ACI9OJ_002208, partial [Myxococcota bacterium]
DPHHAPDTYNMATGMFTWKWYPCCNDGLVISGLNLADGIVITPLKLTGVSGIDYVDGTGDRIALPNKTDAITIGQVVCCAPSTEMCNGADNDCDGVIDNDVNGAYVEVVQEAQASVVTPVTSGLSHSAFYDYHQAKDWASDTGFEVSNRFTVLLHEDPSGDVALMLLTDASNDGSGGTAKLHIGGLDGTTLLVKNDPSHAPDTYNMATGMFTWQWFPCCNDGLVISGLNLANGIVITPLELTGVSGIDYVDGTDERIALPNKTGEISIGQIACIAP